MHIRNGVARTDAIADQKLDAKTPSPPCARAKQLAPDQEAVANRICARFAARYQADWKRAADVYREALAFLRQEGDREGVATTLNNLGVVASRQGDLEWVEDAYTEALALYRQEGRRSSTALVLGNLEALAWRRASWPRRRSWGAKRWR